MKATYKRTNPSVPHPKYMTPQSVAFDITSDEDIVVEAHEMHIISTGLIIRPPEGHFLMVASRSSLPVKKGLMIANGVGIIDPDYCGPKDEIKLIVYNLLSVPVVINSGERLAQGVFLPMIQAQFQETGDNIEDYDRGGIGSTGGMVGASLIPRELAYVS